MHPLPDRRLVEGTSLRAHTRVTPLLLAALATSCDSPTDPAGAPVRPSLTVVVQATGSGRDADGVTALLASGVEIVDTAHVALGDSAVFGDLAPGEYGVSLRRPSVSTWCDPGGQRPVSVGDGPSRIEWEVECVGEFVYRAEHPDFSSNVWYVDGEGVRRLLVEDAVNWEISPDGGTLAFFRKDPGVAAGAGTTFLLHLDGAAPAVRLRPARACSDLIRDVAWAPASDALVAHEVDLDGDCFTAPNLVTIYDARLGTPTRVVTESYGPVAADWSPDGSTLALVRDGAVHLVQAGGSGERLLARVDVGAPLPRVRWSPTGEHVALNGIPQRVLAIDARDGRVRDVVPLDYRPPFGLVEAAWTPDGSGLSYVGVARELRGERSALFVYDLATDSIRQLFADFGEWTIMPSWAPDGRSVLFAGFSSLHLGSAETDAVRPALVPEEGGFATYPQWRFGTWAF